MNRKYKITIPEPCHENWDKMTPKESGRFCLSCSKTVIDFTTMLPEEVQHFFIQNQNESICGRFKKSQLDTITIQIPSTVLYTQTHYHKMFLLALFIAMGTTLFSCQDKNGNKQKIDKVEVVEENVLEKNLTKGKALKGENENPPPPKVDHTKSVKHKNLSKFKNKHQYSSKKTNPQEVLNETRIYEEDTTVYGFAGIDINPDYPGGIELFYDIFRNEYKIPKQLKKSTGVIKMSFTIEKDGRLDELKIVEDLGFESGDQAIQILKKLIKWTPGEINGRKVRTYYNLPITFELDTLNPKRRKRKFSKITSMQIIKTGQSNEQTDLNLKP